MTLEHRRSSYDVDQLTTSTKRPTSLRNVRLATGKNQQPSSIYFELSELFNLKLFPPWVGTTLLLKLSPPSMFTLDDILVGRYGVFALDNKKYVTR